jgi:molybdopterin synthase catalytic subunit
LVKFLITEAPFDPWALLAEHQGGASTVEAGRFGATASFVGTMRDFNEGRAVQAMLLEHYPGMTERHLEKIAREVLERWEIIDVLIVHRVGTISPGEPIVLVAVWASHRGSAFGACRYLVENLKSRAPFWKKESLDGAGQWVERNTPDR